MKTKITTLPFAMLLSLLTCIVSQDLMAQPVPTAFTGRSVWRTPTITNPRDVRIGSLTPIRTDNRYSNFLRFSSPVDVSVRIEGDARWAPNPEAALFVLGSGRPAQVASDDDSGPHRDFLIEHRLLAHKTYVLQVGTRNSTTTTVSITTNQISVRGEIEAQTLRSRANQDGILIGGFGESFRFQMPEAFGPQNSEPSWNLSNDFGSCMQLFGANERTFTVENFAINQSSFRIDSVSVTNNASPFTHRQEAFPASHADAFLAERLDNSRFKVTFNPADAGFIEAKLSIKYSYDNKRLEAFMPLIGRGLPFFPDSRNVAVPGTGQTIFSVINHELSTNIERDGGPVWMNLNFDVPVTNVFIYVIRKGVGSSINASFYGRGDEYIRGQQLVNYGRYSYGNFIVNRQTSVNLKLSLPTEVEEDPTAFDIHVYASR